MRLILLGCVALITAWQPPVAAQQSANAADSDG